MLTLKKYRVPVFHYKNSQAYLLYFSFCLSYVAKCVNLFHNFKFWMSFASRYFIHLYNIVLMLPTRNQ